MDADGNRTAKQDDLAGVTSNYTYDKIYELTQVTQGANTTESYGYDPVGNRLSSLGLSPYNVNTSNELTSTPNASYTYDNNGNTRSKTNSSGTTNYTWDYENRLTQVTLPGQGGTVQFKYDPLSRRIEKMSPSGTTIFVYDMGNIVESVNGSGAEVARYASSPQIDEPLAESAGGVTDFYEQDGVGSVTSLSTGTGQVAQSYTFDSFGNTTNSSGNVANPFRFSGRDFDTETGLYYFRARYYDPTTGRFLSEDPIRFAGGGSLYEYVLNRPVLLTDPVGLSPQGSPQPPPTRWQRFWGWLGNLITPTQIRFGPTLYNLCNSGQTLLFNGASPINPYYGNDAQGHANPNTQAQVDKWEDEFRDKCDAAQKPGQATVVYCGQSALGPNGPIKTCSCCSFCDNSKGKK